MWAQRTTCARQNTLDWIGDDIILLSGSLNDLQSMLSVCDNVSSQLLLKFNTNKCKCIAFGKMTKSAMSGDGLQ